MSSSNGLDRCAIRARVRELLERNALPRGAQTGMWGGPGLGERCCVCGLPIRADELEVEVRFEGEGAPIQLRLHQFCHAAWEMERQAG